MSLCLNCIEQSLLDNAMHACVNDNKWTAISAVPDPNGRGQAHPEVFGRVCLYGVGFFSLVF